MRDLRHIHEPWEDQFCSVAAAVIGAAVVGAGATAYASNKASKAVDKATTAETTSNNQAIDLQRKQYEQQRADYEPWRQVGMGALEQLATTYNIATPPGTAPATPTTPSTPAAGQFGAFVDSPDYQFRVDQGVQAITGNRAARGLLDSGSHGAGLMNYGQEAASQEYGNWFTRLAGLAGVGQTAVNASTAAGQNAVNQQTGIIHNQGQNLSSSYLTRGGIQAGMIQGVGSAASGLIQNWPQQPQGMIPPPSTGYGYGANAGYTGGSMGGLY